MSNVITANNLTLSYDNEEVIIKNANFSIKKGDFVFITGLVVQVNLRYLNLFMDIFRLLMALWS